MVSPWLIIVKIPPSRPCVVRAKMPTTTNPRCATDEYATNRFRFGCMVATMAP